MAMHSRYFKDLRSGFALLLVSVVLACSSVTSDAGKSLSDDPTPTNQPPAPSESADPNRPSGNTAVILGSNFTDPIGSLSLLPIDGTRTPTLNLQTTHSDALVRAFSGLLYVVNRLGQDNIEVIDPADGFRVTRQFSTGAGTNPQDIIVTSPTKAYVSLYQPEDNTSRSLTVDDLLIVNPSSGEILKTIDLTPLAEPDGEPLARASSMVIVGKRLFVALQDLPQDLSRPADHSGKIALIDTTTDQVVGKIILKGRNPFSMAYSPATQKIYVVCAYFVNLLPDLTAPYGGIEVIDPATGGTEGLVIQDEDLGGAPGEIETLGEEGFVTVGFADGGSFATKVVRFNLTDSKNRGITTLYRGKAYIQDIAVDSNGLLLVGDRDPHVNGIVFVNPATGNVVAGPINTGAAPSSITFLDR